MQGITRKEAEKYIRRTARTNGMTFKSQNARINGFQTYLFEDRETGATVISNCTFWSAYECCLSGHIEEHSKKKG